MAQSELPKTKTFVEQINLLRGAFAERERRYYRAEQKFSKNLIFRTAVKRCFLLARASLPEFEFNFYLDWYYEQLQSRITDLDLTPIGCDYLNGIVIAPPVSLDKELSWIAARLIKEIEALRKFRVLADQINNAALLGNFGDALQLLAKVIDRFGESMWSVQLRLGLEQCHGGLEAQKKYYEAIRTEHKRGILAYVAYNTSVRNEDRTSLARYYDALSARITTKYDADIQSYLRYRLFGEWALTDNGIADVLRIEQSHSIIDLYETLVNLGQEVCRRSDLDHITELLRPTFETLKDLKDFRIDKLLAFLGSPLNLSRLEKRSLEPLKALTRSEIANIAKTTTLKEASIDPWMLILCF